jgi:hypothetical protein
MGIQALLFLCSRKTDLLTEAVEVLASHNYRKDARGSWAIVYHQS